MYMTEMENNKRKINIFLSTTLWIVLVPTILGLILFVASGFDGMIILLMFFHLIHIVPALLFVCFCMGWSCNSRSGGKQSFGDDSVSHSSQRVFYVADRRGDMFLISSLGAAIVDNKVMW